jgi:uncharacterized protein YndB with AHSA1/START domain
MSDKLQFVYVTYIGATSDAIWHGLTDRELSAEYWGHHNVSDWQVGSAWEHQRIDASHAADVVGTVLESVASSRLALTWAGPGDEPARGPSRVTFAIEPFGGIVRLTVTHDDLADDAERDAAASGWAGVLSNLKSFLETGHPLPQPPWDMPRHA